MVVGNLVSLNYGASIVYPSEGFEPITSLECVDKYKTTLLYGVPTMFISMLNEL
jgi:fatty-acyl-CoA synthase